MAILREFAEDDPSLKEHIQSTTARYKYTSPDVQNELLIICAKQISDKIVEDCNEAGFFSVLGDECTDKSTKEQMSICLRFIDPGTKDVREDFLCFVEPENTKGETIARCLLGTLEKEGVVIDRMRGQGYDGAANMSGKFRRVQAIVRERVSTATYVHCKAHQLNLALIHSSKEPCVRNMMGIVQDIAFAFDYSAKRLNAFATELSNCDENVKEAMEKRSKLTTLCETRWSARADSLFTFKSAFPVVVQALEYLRDNRDEKAGAYLAAILKFEFLIALVVAEHILSVTVALSNFLQSKSCDLIEAVGESKVVVQSLRDERNDPAVWDALYGKAVEIAADFELNPCTPRRAGRQMHRANHPVQDPQEYWKVSLYYIFLDHLVQELESRLIQSEDRFLAEYLVPVKLQGLTPDNIEKIYNAYNDDIGTLEQLQEEISRWKTRWSMTMLDTKPKTLHETLVTTNKNLYPNISTIISVLLTMPASTATAERSFSAMNRIKTYLRSTMGTDRLSALATLHIYRDVEIDRQNVITKFASVKGRKLNFLL
ncbi:unnamed protein product [Mytilus edulis]|uniref:Uncharacterized protein n=1 Tax=Mytilus edulis TaxID=6550 RepID=A0A8S3TKW3_MYTED|nr:unnamed protein product [Mytilus edulis]